MKFKELQHVRAPTGVLDEIEQRIERAWLTEMYLPLMREIGNGRKSLTNAMHGLVERPSEILLEAISSGKIQWINGHFEGKLDAVISRELRAAGATWDTDNKWWSFPTELLSTDIKMAMGQADSAFKRMAQKVDAALAKIQPGAVADKVKLEHLIDSTMYKTDRRLSETISSITVTPEITDTEKLTIRLKYQHDVERGIKGWTEEEVVKLRDRVQKETLKGVRYENLTKIIKESFVQSQNKAKFLARQETNLFLSQFKQTRYERAGIYSYTWKCVAGSPMHPVRPDHLRLNNTVQLYKDPPVTNQRTRACNNPGCDFGCRCYDRPIVRF